MKVRIIKSKLVEIEKTKLQEVWDKELRKWDILEVETIYPMGKTSNLVTYDGDVIVGLPNDCFEEVKN